MAKFDETVSDPDLRGLGATRARTGGNSGVMADAVGTLGKVGLAIAGQVGSRRNEKNLKDFYTEGQDIISSPVDREALGLGEPLARPSPQELIEMSRNQEKSEAFAQRIHNVSTARTMGAREKQTRLRQLRDQALNDHWHLRDEINGIYRQQIGELGAIQEATASGLTATEQSLVVAKEKADQQGISVSLWLHSQSVKELQASGAWQHYEGGERAKVIGEGMSALATDFIVEMNSQFGEGVVPDLGATLERYEAVWNETLDVRNGILEEYPRAGQMGLEYARKLKDEGIERIKNRWNLRHQLPAQQADHAENSLRNTGIAAINKHLPELASLVIGGEDQTQAALSFVQLLLGDRALTEDMEEPAGGTAWDTWNEGIAALTKQIEAQQKEQPYQAGAPKPVYDIDDLTTARAMLQAQQQSALNKVVGHLLSKGLKDDSVEFEDKQEAMLKETYKDYREDVKARTTNFLMEMNMIRPIVGFNTIVESLEEEQKERKVVTDIKTGKVSDINMTEALVNFPKIRSSMQDPEFQSEVEKRTRTSFAKLTQGLQSEELNPQRLTWDDFEIVRYPREDMQGGMTRRAMPPGGFIDIRLKEQGTEPSGERIPIQPGRSIPGMRKKKSLNRSLERTLRQLTMQVNTALFWHEDVESAVGGFPEGVAVDDSAMKLDADGVQGLQAEVQRLEQDEAKDEILAKQGDKRAADRLTLLNNYRSRLAGQEERVRRYNPDTGRIE